MDLTATVSFSDMLAMAGQAAVILADPMRLGFLFAGVLMGLVVGVIPGLGGIVGLTLLLPFTYALDPYSAIAMMLGLGSVTVTSDTIPAVLFGVPGTVGSAATSLDGYPMARRGEASRAFGAAFTSSVLGGLFGALLLAVSLPLLRPFMVSFSEPEMLAICIFGLSLVAVLSGSAPIKGLIAAALGLLVATAGNDQEGATLRWTFDSMYLWDGVPLVPFALGIFAIPELADLAITRATIAGDTKSIRARGQLEGVKDVFKSWFLVLRCALIGSVMGSIPGLGASVIDWVAYGHAARTEKGATESFGKGDVRGVIASESSNNAKEGGALVPTIAFGVPGSASMALLLGAFLIQGIVPGPKMLTEKLDLTYTMVWSVALANVLGAGVCFAFAGQLARIAMIRVGILVPLVLWPRPPIILGFVLGGLIENYLFISISRWGFDWLTRPMVIIIFAITLISVLWPLYSGYRQSSKSPRGGRQFAVQRDYLRNPDLVFTILVFGIFLYAVIYSTEWELATRLEPQAVGWFGVVATGLVIFTSLLIAPAERKSGDEAVSGQMTAAGDDIHFDIQADYGDLSSRVIYTRAARYFFWCGFYIGSSHVVGLIPALALFLVGYMRFEGKESWRTILFVVGPMWMFCYGLFHLVLRVLWPQTLFGQWFPVFRSIRELNLF
jgi:TctA family transporter